MHISSPKCGKRREILSTTIRNIFVETHEQALGKLAIPMCQWGQRPTFSKSEQFKEKWTGGVAMFRELFSGATELEKCKEWASLVSKYLDIGEETSHHQHYLQIWNKDFWYPTSEIRMYFLIEKTKLEIFLWLYNCFHQGKSE